MLVAMLVAVEAGAHAFIDKTQPAVGGTVKQSPPEVELSFTEALEAKFSRVQVFDATGKEVDKKDGHADPRDAKRLIVSLPAGLSAGAYKVVWHAVSIDTHVTDGNFTYRVEP